MYLIDVINISGCVIVAMYTVGFEAGKVWSYVVDLAVEALVGGS